jgi:Holliday junction DNA helicase RuvB
MAPAKWRGARAARRALPAGCCAGCATFAQSGGEAEVNARVADGSLTRMEVDHLGLDAMDRRYLTMIADIYKGGPVGVETLAAGLSEPRDTIEEVIEPYLIQLGLIARTARGRCLNGPGWIHLGLPQPKTAQTGLFDAK